MAAIKTKFEEDIANYAREGTCYQDMAAIKTKFEEDIANCATQAAATSSAPTHGEAGETKGTVKSLAEASNSKAIALQSHKHIKVDKLYTLKNEPAKVWKLLELTETVAKLSHRPFFADKDELKEIKFSDLRNLKEWIKDAPQLIDEAGLATLLPCNSAALEEELGKAQAYCALVGKYQELPSCICTLNMQVC